MNAVSARPLFSPALFLAIAIAPIATTTVQAELLFNQVGEHQTSSHGYYYQVTGGKFVNGQTVNGNNGSGGVFRFILDDPVWGRPLNVWTRDDWFPENAGLALTMYSDGTIVFDNNGIETGETNGYYTNDNDFNNPKAGLYIAYSMANNYDWIYSGYFKLAEDTTVDKIVGYFDGDGYYGLFNPDSPFIKYGLNIWNSVEGTGSNEGYLMPADTAGFFGDVLSSETVSSAYTPGSFSWSETDVSLLRYEDGELETENAIYRLEYTLDEPVTLGAGEYFFGTNAQVVPEPGSVVGLIGASLMGAVGFLVVRRRRRRLAG